MFRSVRLTAAATTIGSAPNTTRHSTAGLTNKYGVMLARRLRPQNACCSLPTLVDSTSELIGSISNREGTAVRAPAEHNGARTPVRGASSEDYFFCRPATCWLSF